MRRISWLAVTFLFAATTPAFAWIDTGHKLTAMIAWEDLTPKTRAAVIELLRKHPRYEKDLLGDYPRDADSDAIARHALAVASTWPDLIKDQSHPMRAVHNHPQWHYIDVPLELGIQAQLRPPQGRPPHNVVQAIDHTLADVKDDKAPADKRAIAICWLTHLIGDIHQPLHACTRYSPQFPRGDAGGNQSIVLRDPPHRDSRASLHFIWDSFPGNFQSEFIMLYLANGLRNDPRFSREAFKDRLTQTTADAWAKESHEIGVKYVHLDGQLQVATTERGSGPIPGLPEGYKDTAEVIAMERVVLAGYRMADALNAIFDPKD